MLFVHNDMVEKLITMGECIEAPEHAFRKIPDGGAIHRPRLDMYVPCELDDGYWRWGAMEGANDGIFAIRMKSDVITWPKDATGAWRENKYCVRPGLFCGLIMLFSTDYGEPLAFINDGLLQHMRVGAGGGIGAKHLARAEDPGGLGSHGSVGRGTGRRAHVHATRRARRKCYSCALTSSTRTTIAARAHGNFALAASATSPEVTISAVPTRR